MKQEQLLLSAGKFTKLNSEYVPKFRNYTTDEFFYKPTPKKWSVAQCLDHLNIIHSKLVPAIERLLETASVVENGRNEVPKFGIMDSLLIWSMKGTFKIPAPGKYTPNPKSNANEIIAEFESYNERWLEIIEKAKEASISGLFVPSPAIPIMKLSVLGWIVSSAWHSERHGNQAVRTVKSLVGE